MSTSAWPFDNIRQYGDPQGITGTLNFNLPTGDSLTINLTHLTTSDAQQANQAFYGAVSNFADAVNTAASQANAAIAAALVPKSTGAASGTTAATGANYSDPNPSYTNGSLTFTTTLAASHVPGNQSVPNPFGRGSSTLNSLDAAAAFIAGDVSVTVTGTQRATKNSIPFTVTGVQVVFPTTIYYNTSSWTYSNGVPSLAAQYAENQHAIDFWTARDTIVIPMLNERLSQPFNGLPRNAEQQIRDLILRTFITTNQETIQRYDLPKGSAPHNGGSNPVPSDYKHFP